MFEKILVPVELGLEGARNVLRRASALSHGELWAVHVVEPQYIQYSIDPTFSGSLTRAMENDAIAAARERLAEICGPLNIPQDHQLVALGRPADQIHELAREYAVDTIIMGSHERSGIQRLLGSTANAVLHDSPVNVLTIRTHGGDS